MRQLEGPGAGEEEDAAARIVKENDEVKVKHV